MTSMLLRQLVVLLSLAVALARVDTPLGKMVRHSLIETPARELNRLTLQNGLVAVAVFLFLIALVLGAALGAPDWFAFFAIGDLSFYIEAFVAAALVRTVVRLSLARALAIEFVRRVFARIATWRRSYGTRKRAPHSRPRKLPPASEDDHPAWARWGSAAFNPAA